jgi:hypothetical protein
MLFLKSSIDILFLTFFILWCILLFKGLLEMVKRNLSCLNDYMVPRGIFVICTLRYMFTPRTYPYIILNSNDYKTLLLIFFG